MTKFKNSISVNGSINHLKAFAKDLEEIGYKYERENIDSRLSEVSKYSPHIWVNRNYLGEFCSGVFTVAGNKGDHIETKLSLPIAWNIILELASEKEETKEEYKVGDWVYINDPECGKASFEVAQITKDYYSDLYKLNNYKNEIYWSDRDFNKSWFRKATHEEIESHLIKEAEKKGFVKGAKVNTNPIYQSPGIYTLGDGKYKLSKSRNDYHLEFQQKNSCAISIYKNGIWGELLHSHPIIEIGSRKVEFFDNYVKVGCKDIYSDSILRLNAAIQQWGDKTYGVPIQSFQIQGAIIRTEILTQIAEHFNNK